MERWEEVKPGGLRFVWDGDLFRPGTDTFLLSAFPKLKPGLRVCDLGCGTGLLGMLLLSRQGEITVTGIEKNADAAALAGRCVQENSLTDRAFVVQMDIRDARDRFPSGSFDLIVSNPPYYARGRGREARDPVRRLARSEGACSWEDWTAAAAYLLRWGGRFCFTWKPERLTDALCTLREGGMEPKRLRLACTRPGDAPFLALIEGRRGGSPGMDVERPLFLRRADGTDAAELDAVYFRKP